MYYPDLVKRFHFTPNHSPPSSSIRGNVFYGILDTFEVSSEVILLSLNLFLGLHRFTRLQARRKSTTWVCIHPPFEQYSQTISYRSIGWIGVMPADTLASVSGVKKKLHLMLTMFKIRSWNFGGFVTIWDGFNKMSIFQSGWDVKTTELERNCCVLFIICPLYWHQTRSFRP